MELIYFFILLLCCVFAYKYGEKKGRFEEVMLLAKGIRGKIENSLIKPWYSDFKSHFIVKRAEKESYEVDQRSLLACFELAKKSYEVRKYVSDNEIFKSNLGYSLTDYVCSYVDFERTPKGITIDAYFGNPGGYVDAFLHLIVMTGGKYPKETWLNEKTGDITDSPKQDEKYMHIFL